MSLPGIGQSPESSTEKLTDRDDFNAKVAPPDNHERNSPSQTRSTPVRNTPPPTGLATRSASDEPSEATELTMWATYINESAFDDEPCVTLQGEIPGHGSNVDVDVTKDAHAIPPMRVPGLLQGISAVSPSRLSLDREGGVVREADEDSSDSGDDLSQYSATEKGKRKAQTDGDAIHTGWVGKSSADFELETPDNTVKEWVIATKGALKHYEDRQVSLPLGPRLNVTIAESSKFVLGVLKLLANRDLPGCTDPSRQLGQLLIENFVDVKFWAKDYFRSRYAMQDVDNGVLTILVIVLNNFYQGQVQLIDRIVKFALDNMRNSGRIGLNTVDFAFGFDFSMSQDLPFAVETKSKIREELDPVPAAVTPLTSEPVVTHSGRQVRPTERAQAASQQGQPNRNRRRNKAPNSSQPKDKEAAKSTVPRESKNEDSTQPSYQRTKATTMPSPDSVKPAPPAKTASERTKHRPTRRSNLGLSTSGSTRSRPEDSSKSEQGNSASADSPKVSGPKGAHPTVNSTPRFSIRLPAMRLRTSSTPTTGGPQSTLGMTSSSTPQSNSLAAAGETTTDETPPPGVARLRGRPNGRGRGCRRKRGNTTLTQSTDGSTVLLHAVDNSSGAGGDTPPTPQNTQRSELLLPPNDPGHPQGKKRKLDDCED